jgi:hypothetical protein
MPGVLLVGSMCVSAFFSDVQRSKHQEALDDDVLVCTRGLARCAGADGKV